MRLCILTNAISLVQMISQRDLVLSVFLPSFSHNKTGLYAVVAQQVEHFLGKEEVTGSSPVNSSIDKCHEVRPIKF